MKGRCNTYYTTMDPAWPQGRQRRALNPVCKQARKRISRWHQFRWNKQRNLCADTMENKRPRGRWVWKSWEWWEENMNQRGEWVSRNTSDITILLELLLTTFESTPISFYSLSISMEKGLSVYSSRKGSGIMIFLRCACNPFALIVYQRKNGSLICSPNFSAGKYRLPTGSRI